MDRCKYYGSALLKKDGARNGVQMLLNPTDDKLDLSILNILDNILVIPLNPFHSYL
jgi:hypothetical protein